MQGTYILLPFDEEGFKKFFAELLHDKLRELNLIQPEEKPEDEWLDVTAVSRILKRDKSRIYAYTRASILQGYKLPGLRGGLRYRRSEVEQCLKALDFSQNIKTKPSNF
jgi:hypothetical protein